MSIATENRNQSYRESKHFHPTQEEKILDFLVKRPSHARIIANGTDIDRSDVRRALSTMVKKGKVREKHKTTCEITGKPVTVYEAVLKLF